MKKFFRKGPVIISATLLGFFFLLCILLFVLFYFWFDGLGVTLSRLVHSDTRLPVVVTVFGRSTETASTNTDTLSARINFYSPEGEIAGTVERSWAGWELKIDCIMIGTENGFLVFPFLAYTDETKRGHGVDLLRCYTQNNFPVIYKSSALTDEEYHALYLLFAMVQMERWMPRFLGTLHHEIISIRSFEAGKEYSLFAKKDGTICLTGN